MPTSTKLVQTRHIFLLKKETNGAMKGRLKKTLKKKQTNKKKTTAKKEQKTTQQQQQQCPGPGKFTWPKQWTRKNAGLHKAEHMLHVLKIDTKCHETSWNNLHTTMLA